MSLKPESIGLAADMATSSSHSNSSSDKSNKMTGMYASYAGITYVSEKNQNKEFG